MGKKGSGQKVRRVKKDKLLRPKSKADTHKAVRAPEATRLRAQFMFKYFDLRLSKEVDNSADSGPSSLKTEMVLDKLKHFEDMSHAQKRQHGSHSVSADKLIKKAQDAIRDLPLSDCEVYSLRLGGKGRLWCLRTDQTYMVLWLDLYHRIYPTPKKHT